MLVNNVETDRKHPTGAIRFLAKDRGQRVRVRVRVRVDIRESKQTTIFIHDMTLRLRQKQNL